MQEPVILTALYFSNPSIPCLFALHHNAFAPVLLRKGEQRWVICSLGKGYDQLFPLLNAHDYVIFFSYVGHRKIW